LNAGLINDELVAVLETLTRQGKVQWFQRTVDPGLVFCFVNGELIKFETCGGDGNPALPSTEIHGILAQMRNISFLWLRGSEAWDTLLERLRGAPTDDDAWPPAYIECENRAINDLRKYAGA
jgi:hypothetical protein